jgi:hypothetical protein
MLVDQPSSPPGNTEAVMNKELIELVLPRLAQRLHQQLKRYQAGELDQDGFTRDFEDLLQRQYAWLAKRGVPEPEAAVAIHSAVLVLSGPGLRAEAEQLKLPLEVVEYRAVRTAAADISANYGVSQTRATRQITAILAQYGE